MGHPAYADLLALRRIARADNGRKRQQRPLGSRHSLESRGPCPSTSCSSSRTGEPADPAVFVTHCARLHEGDLFVPRGGERFRILAIEPSSDANGEFHAVWTVEPFPG
jgi:hypothetical protein